MEAVERNDFLTALRQLTSGCESTALFLGRSGLLGLSLVSRETFRTHGPLFSNVTQTGETIQLLVPQIYRPQILRIREPGRYPYRLPPTAVGPLIRDETVRADGSDRPYWGWTNISGDVAQTMASVTELHVDGSLRVENGLRGLFGPRLLGLRLSGKTLASDLEVLPVGLKRLSFGIQFDESVDRLPPGLIELGLGVELPVSVGLILTPGRRGLNSQVQFLDVSAPLIRLVGYRTFNRAVDHLPVTLEVLIVGFRFNQSIDHLPPHLRELELGGCFDQAVDHLPESLRRLRIGPRSKFSKALDHLPSGLQELHLGLEVCPRLDNLPASLCVLGVNVTSEDFEPLDHLPHGLRELQLEGETRLNSSDNFPATLVELTLPRNYNEPVDWLPGSLRRLLCGYAFNQSVDHLPGGLRKLTFGCLFNRDVHHLPDGLCALSFGHAFNRRVDYLPRSLEALTFGARFNRSINRLPTTLRALELGSQYRQVGIRFPVRLETLRIYARYPLDLRDCHYLQKVELVQKFRAAPWPVVVRDGSETPVKICHIYVVAAYDGETLYGSCDDSEVAEEAPSDGSVEF